MSPSKVSQMNQRSSRGSLVAGAHAAPRERVGRAARPGDFDRAATRAALAYAEPDFPSLLSCPVYAYNRDAQVVDDLLNPYYFDESAAGYEARRFLGDPADAGRRRVFINCFIRLHWQHLGIWNPNWGVPGRKGSSNDPTTWRWRWEDKESINEVQQVNTATQCQNRYFDYLRAARTDFSDETPSKRAYLERDPTMDRAQAFITSRPWFVFGAQVEAKRRMPLIGRRDIATAMKRVRKVWQMKGVWQSQWDHDTPGWKWSGDGIKIQDPRLLPDMLSMKEKIALGMIEEPRPLPSCQSRHSVVRGHRSPNRKANRSSDRYRHSRPLDTSRSNTHRRPSPKPNNHTPSVLKDIKPRKDHMRNQVSNGSQFSQLSGTSQASQARLNSTNSVMAQIHGPRYTSLVPGEGSLLGSEDRFEGIGKDETGRKEVRNTLGVRPYGSAYASAAGPAGQDDERGGSGISLQVIKEEEKEEAQEVPKIQVSIENSKLGLSPFEFSL